jgi:exonuclease VII small subunit
MLAFISAAAAVTATTVDVQTPVAAQVQEDTSRQVESVTTELERLDQRIKALEKAKEELERAKAAYEDAAKAIAKEQEQIEQRVDELEVAKTAQEDATRAIIRDSVSTMGPQINEFVTLGGTLEVLAGGAQSFTGQTDRVLAINTAEIDLEVNANDWTVGSLVIEYLDGSNAIFTTNEGRDAAVDRFNINTASITVGNPQKFPLFGTFGRMIMPFGISTGDPVADVLTIEDPLTIQVFEMRENAIGFGVAFPTPVPRPAAPPVTPPRVKPLVVNPLVKSISKGLGYSPPPTRPPPPTPIFPAPPPPLFNAGFYLYDGSTFDTIDRGMQTDDHWGATIGFRTKGNCGRSYDRLADERRGWLYGCPWAVDIDVDYNRSVFDSQFLEFEYQSFLSQIGIVPGMAASIKGNLGPVSLVGEWNGAIDHATFTDDLGTPIAMRPSAWQLSLGYQFDWNPWVEAIGLQGTYVAIGYSESQGLAGATEIINGVPTRVGFVPRKRLLLSAGEWVLDGLKFSIEYSHVIDYKKSDGGTGGTADGLFGQLTYVW